MGRKGVGGGACGGWEGGVWEAGREKFKGVGEGKVGVMGLGWGWGEGLRVLVMVNEKVRAIEGWVYQLVSELSAPCMECV